MLSSMIHACYEDSNHCRKRNAYLLTRVMYLFPAKSPPSDLAWITTQGIRLHNTLKICLYIYRRVLFTAILSISREAYFKIIIAGVLHSSLFRGYLCIVLGKNLQSHCILFLNINVSTLNIFVIKQDQHKINISSNIIKSL